MKDHGSGFSVEKMALTLKVSRSGYYDWAGRVERERTRAQRLFDIEVKSARGVQYCCDAVRKALVRLHFVQSMSRKGNCWDNAVSESFFGTLKTEWLSDIDLYDREHAEQELFKYIEQFYNGQRIHTTIGMPPVIFEKRKSIKCA
jgi:transposase InsO family protein